jgi:CO/xanthine dehydrogenase FAD-binding subunit
MRLFKDFVVPGSLDEARAELKRLGPEGMPLAGATSLLFMRHKEPRVAVDLSRAGLSGLVAEADHFVIGAMTSITALREYRAEGWVLDQVAGRFVTQQIRNQSTLGGNIVRVFAWADFPVALLALGASMTIRGDEERRVLADEFFNGQPVRLLKTGDLLASVIVPAVKPGQGFGYHKQTRVSADFSQGTAAAWLEVEGGKIKAARVALGASLTFPCRLAAVEQAVLGQKGGEKLFREAATHLGERSWRTVAGFAPDYIKHIGQVAVSDALLGAWQSAIK